MSLRPEWFLLDVRHSFRRRLRASGSTATIALTLGVGLACNAVAFSLTHTLLIRPYPFRALERLVLLREGKIGDPRLSTALAPADLNDIARETTHFDGVARYRYIPVELTGSGEPVRVRAFAVSANFFEILGLEAVRGRALASFDAGADGVAVLSHGLWKRQFGGDSAIVGRQILVAGRERQIVGVMGPNINFPRAVDLWIPLGLTQSEEQERTRSTLSAIARLSRETTVSTARSALAAFASTLAASYPASNAGRRLDVIPLREEQYEYTLPFFATLEVAALFVLLVAGINASNIFVTERLAHRQEHTMRILLGATRFQLALAGLWEALLLAGLGVSIAVPLSWWAVGAIRKAMPQGIAMHVAGWSELEVNSPVLAVSVAMALILAAALGWSATLAFPAFANAGGIAHREVSSVGTHRFGRMAVTIQLVAAFVLLSAGSAVLTGFTRIAHMFETLEPDGVLFSRVTAPPNGNTEPFEAAFYQRVLSEVRKISSIRSAAMVTNLPASNVPNARISFTIERRPPASPAEMPAADIQIVGGSFFESLRIPVLKGRILTDTDQTHSTPVVVISETMARLHWAPDDPVGRRIRLGAWGDTGPWWTIVGVAADVKQNWFDPLPRPIVYVPVQQRPARSMTVIIRTEADPLSAAESLRQALRRIDPSRSSFEAATLRSEIDDSIAPIRLVGIVLTLFATVTLLTATIGVYGVVSDDVARRTREVGLRMALGAAPSRVIAALVWDTVRVCCWCLGIGLPAAIWFQATARSKLYNLVSVDPTMLAGLCIVLFAAAMLATALPARRAASVDPAEALRSI